MAELRTLVRPYAQAVFAHACAAGELAAWGATLEFLAAIINDRQMQAALHDPRMTPARVTALLLAIGGERLTPGTDKLIGLMATHRRLSLLPQLAELYVELRATHENSLAVTIDAATPLGEAQRQQMQVALSRRYRRQVRLEERSKPELLGGFVVQAGDQVMDGSVRARLQALAATLKAQAG